MAESGRSKDKKKEEAPFSVPKKIEEDYTHERFGVKKELHGKLFLARKYKSRVESKSIVIKKCRNPLQSTRRAKLLLRHLNLLRTLKHENIVRLLGSYSRLEDKIKSVYTVTEYAGEPMSEFIKKGTYSMSDVKKWMREMLLAVQYLHSNGVIHRNLHPGNICIDEDNKLTLIALGHARVIDRDQNMTKDSGTQPYTPIELIVEWDGPYDEMVDIWSIAALLCDLLTFLPLFSDADNSSETSLKS